MKARPLQGRHCPTSQKAMKARGGLCLEQGVCWIPGGVSTKQPITGLHPAVHMALASVAACQCSAHEGYLAILAGTGDPPAVAKG